MAARQVGEQILEYYEAQKGHVPAGSSFISHLSSGKKNVKGYLMPQTVFAI